MRGDRSDDYIKALKVCKYFTYEGIKNLADRYPNEDHIKIALRIKAKNQVKVSQ